MRELVRRLSRVPPRAALPVMLALSITAATPAYAFKILGIPFFEPNTPALSPDAQPYTITVTVAGQDGTARSKAEAASLLYADRDQPPPASTPAFLSRAQADYARIVAALYTEGYYGPVVHILVGGRPVEALPPDATLPKPARVTVTVDPGPQFHFGHLAIEGRAPPGAPDDRLKNPPEKLGFVPGQVARSGAVLSSEQAIVDEWRQQGHPKAANTPRVVTADHPTSTLDATIGVNPGPFAVYGPIGVSGTKFMDPYFVLRQSGLRPGQEYDPDDLAEAQRRLRHLDVFSATRIQEAAAVRPDGTLPLTLDVAEEPLHVFGVGGSYSTTDGAGADAYYEFRNLFGHAEHLRFDARIAGINSSDPTDYTYYVGATYIAPGILDPLTDLNATLFASRENWDPYVEDLIRARVGLSHEFSEAVTGSLAINGDIGRDRDAFGKHDFGLVSVPGELAFDGTDDKLEPTRGVRVKLQVEPIQEFVFENTLLQSRVDAASFIPFDEDGRFVLATRASVGSIVGAPIREIPDGRLFFSGGGGSIRGYDYRSLGPEVGPNGEIVGGRSLGEASAELRVHVTDTIGVVPFVDAGNSFAPSYPDFKGRIAVGAGIGGRYYTSIGPLRADFAVPLNREHGDPRFAIYLGLGEAF